MDALDQVARSRLALDEHGEIERWEGSRATRLTSSTIAPAASTESMRRGRDARVADQVWATAAHAHRAHLAHAVDALDRRAQLRLGAGRRAVDEDVAGAPDQHRRGAGDDDGDQQRGHRVRPCEADRARPASPASTPSVESTSDRRLVASACSASLSASTPTRRSTPARPASITSVAIRSTNAYHAGLTIDAPDGEPAHRLERDADRRDHEQHAFGERGEVLRAAVPVRVLRVGRLARTCAPPTARTRWRPRRPASGPPR